jgi:hypothetical protein
MVPRIALSGIGLDVLAWHALPAVFLFLYVSGNFLPADSVVPHLRVVWLALLPLVVLRLGVVLLGLRAGAARVASSLAASLLLALMLSYYVLVLIGLHSWGRVKGRPDQEPVKR